MAGVQRRDSTRCSNCVSFAPREDRRSCNTARQSGGSRRDVPSRAWNRPSPRATDPAKRRTPPQGTLSSIGCLDLAAAPRQRTLGGAALQHNAVLCFVEGGDLTRRYRGRCNGRLATDTQPGVLRGESGLAWLPGRPRRILLGVSAPAGARPQPGGLSQPAAASLGCGDASVDHVQTSQSCRAGGTVVRRHASWPRSGQAARHPRRISPYRLRTASSIRVTICRRIGAGVAKFRRAKPAYWAPNVSPKFNPTLAWSRKNCPAEHDSSRARQSSQARYVASGTRIVTPGSSAEIVCASQSRFARS